MTTKEIAKLIEEANKWHSKGFENHNNTYHLIADKIWWRLNDEVPEFVKDIERKCLYFKLSPKQIWALACNCQSAGRRD
jgi:hypothetical protein